MDNDSYTLLDHLLQGENTKVLIVTDWEPDDMMAIHMLFPELIKRNIIPDIVISCWKDVGTKALFAYQYLKSITTAPINIYLGLPTKKKYNIESMVNTDSAIEFESWNILNWNQYSLIIQLAPINELMTLFNEGMIFENTKLAMYASFNIRSVMKTYNHENILKMLNGFKQVIYYESFLATSPTMVENSDVLDNILKHEAIAKYIRVWNDLIYKEMEYSSSDTCKRIIKSIQDCPDQFVHADTGLILTLIMPLNVIKESLMTGTLTFNSQTNYSTFTDLKESNCDEQMIVVHNKLIQKELFHMHMNHMKKIF